MLTIFSKSNYPPKKWYVIDKAPLKPFQVMDVSYIHATGDELEYIKQMFSHYPSPGIPRGKSIYLYGDIAKNIVANLQSSTE